MDPQPPAARRTREELARRLSQRAAADRKGVKRKTKGKPEAYSVS